jgi:AraC-like DNA-binding protein
LDKYDNNQLSVHPNIVKLAVSALMNMGENPDKILRQAGIEQKRLDTNQRIPSTEMNRLWQICSSRSLNGEFSIQMAKVLLPQHLHRLGDVLVSCKTMHDFLFQVVKYSTLISTAMYAQLIEGKDTTKLTFKQSVPDFIPHSTAFESAMVILITLLKKLLSQDSIGLIEVHMTRSSPLLNCYQDFFQADMHFLATSHSLVFCNSQLNQPLPLFDTNIRSYQEQLIKQDLQEVYHPTFVYQVKSLIDLNLVSNHNIEACVASKLCLSVRTLQRNLSKSQTSFAILLKEARFTKAKQMLMVESHSIKQAAFLLGFNSSASFSRAFKHWSGMPPKEFCEQLTKNKITN